MVFPGYWYNRNDIMPPVMLCLKKKREEADQTASSFVPDFQAAAFSAYPHPLRGGSALEGHSLPVCHGLIGYPVICKPSEHQTQRPILADIYGASSSRTK